MIASKVLRRSLLVLGSCLLFAYLIYFFFPVNRLHDAIDRELAAQGLQLSPSLRKTVIPGIAWEQPTLSSLQGALLHFDTLSVAPDWKSLLSGTVAVSSSATLGKGEVGILYGVNGKKLFGIHIHDVTLEDIPFFKTVLSAKAGGTLWSEGSVLRQSKGVSGEVRLEIKNLSLIGVKLGAFPLPDVSGLTAQGMIRIAPDKNRLESLTLQSEGIYMRLSGDLPTGKMAVSSPLNLSLEIMPKPEFLEKQKLVFMLLAKFAVSPGVYQIPVKGTLMKPEIL